MNYFFTSDTHWHHANIIKYCNRPFSSIEEHDEALIANWNSKVSKNDIVYHLGDFVFGRASDALNLLKRLNFREFKFVWGNHDRAMEALSNVDFPRNVYFLGDQVEVRIPLCFKHSQKIVLNHYSMRVWNKSHHGSWHLYGHSHGTLPDDPNSFSIDVGVDCHNYHPVSFEEIQVIMSKKIWKPIDHHVGQIR